MLSMSSLLLLIVLAIPMSSGARPSGGLFNVLMLAVDDLRPVGEAFGEPEVMMPNVDKLAARSSVFTRAYVQVPTCGASRSSFLTGRRPDTTYVTNNQDCAFSTAPSHSSWQSLPEFFRASGYRTAGHGKIFHPNTCDGAAVGERASAWTEPYYHAPCIGGGSLYAGGCSDPGASKNNPPHWYHPCVAPCVCISDYANATADYGDMPDDMIARQAISTIQKFAEEGSSPFFIAVGFHKPHLPHIAPKKYFDLYPEVSLAPSPHFPEGAPDLAWNQCHEWTNYPDVGNATKAMGFSRKKPVDDEYARQQRRAYFACASYADAQVGRVLSALDEAGLTNTTIVVLFGDHGWHLGDNNEWAKHTAMTRANRAPLLFSVPGAKPSRQAGFAEFVDIFPTLAHMSGISVPPRCDTEHDSQHLAACTEGMSLGPLILGEETGGKKAAFGQWHLGDYMGYNIYTIINGSEVRYTEWVTYDEKNHVPVWSELKSRELYNRTADPEESTNIANHTRLNQTVARLSQQLHDGWRTSELNINAGSFT